MLILAGFPPMPARVFVALLVTDSGRLTAAELADLLQISPAAVSGAVRYLSGLGLVHKERVPGSRREYYRMPADIWHQVMLLRNQVLIRWIALLKEGVGPGRRGHAGRRPDGRARRILRVPARRDARDARPLGRRSANRSSRLPGAASPRPRATASPQVMKTFFCR